MERFLGKTFMTSGHADLAAAKAAGSRTGEP
jgi:hypothetical protein